MATSRSNITVQANYVALRYLVEPARNDTTVSRRTYKARDYQNKSLSVLVKTNGRSLTLLYQNPSPSWIR